MGKSKTPAESAARLLRQTQALQLKAHGHNYRSIAKALGCGVATAHRLVDSAVAAETDGISQAKAEYVRLELIRLDLYLQALAKKIQVGDPRAIDTALKVADRRAKLLGLDAPTKITPTDQEGKALPYRPDLSNVNAEDLRHITEILEKAECSADPIP